MANKKSSKKRIRISAKRAVINSNRKSKVRTLAKRALTTIASGSKDEAEKVLRLAESEMMRAAGKGVITKKAAARKVSRMTKKLKQMA